MRVHRRWYEKVHAPNLIGAGFLSVRICDDGSGTRVRNIYELAGAETLQTKAYRSLEVRDPERNLRVAALEDLSASLYYQVSMFDDQGRLLVPPPPLSKPRLQLLQFDFAGSDRELSERFSRWAETCHCDEGAAVRLLGRTHAALALQSSDPAWCILIENDRETKSDCWPSLFGHLQDRAYTTRAVERTSVFFCMTG
jgi:hypothetical protein